VKKYLPHRPHALGGIRVATLTLATALAAALLGCGNSAPAPGNAGGGAGTTSLGGAGGQNVGGAGGENVGGADAAGGAAGAGGQSMTCVPQFSPFPPTAGGRATDCPDVSGAPLGIAMHPLEGNTHITACSPTCYRTMPPTSGNHYPIWPAYKTYPSPVPWGFLVHGLEHGAVIVVYNCPCGCPDEVAAAQAWIDALPNDPVCATRPRVILAPDPTLDVRWAASAWQDQVGGWTLRSATFDQAVFNQFFVDHYGQAPELVCGSGADGSQSNWCQ